MTIETTEMRDTDKRFTGAQPGNRNAVKPPELRRTSLLQIPVTPKEKASVVKAARGSKLTDYCRARLGIITADRNPKEFAARAAAEADVRAWAEKELAGFEG